MCHQELRTVLGQQQDQHVEDFETMEIKYSIIVHNVVSMSASLMLHQDKDYHHHYVYISLPLHPDSLYAFVWGNERCFLYSL